MSVGVDRARVENLSSNLHIRLGGELSVAPQSCAECELPLTLSVGAYGVHVEAAEQTQLRSLAQPTLIPGQVSSSRPQPLLKLSNGTDGEALVQWFRAVTAVLHSAATSEKFFQQAAQAMIDLVGLDCGQVLLREPHQWKSASLATREPDDSGQVTAQASRTLLARLVDEKRTFWQTPGSQASQAASLVGVQAVVAAPILDRAGEVMGVLYGDRKWASNRAAPQITQLEAMLVETLACGVAAGLARLEQQRAALAAQVQFEQFFTPELSRHLATQPDLLKGRDAEVTLLFCDVRGFSRISERLTPAATVQWIGSVMSALSDCVSAHRGVLVDYIGDELIALWGAPEKQDDHAQLACSAALDMLRSLDTLNLQWQDVLGEPIRVGIGINSGLAHVGNTGSSRKFKYGPLGNTVNIGSRVQGATKYLRSDVLITAATRAQLAPDAPVRRLGKVRVMNISEPVDLYELAANDSSSWRSLQVKYEQALEQIEAGDFRKPARILGELLAEYPGDGPSLVLLSRAINCLINIDAPDHRVWNLPGK